MFCRNCGNEMDAQAVVCVKCGVPKGSGSNFCHNCGQPTNPLAAVCTQCGVALNNVPQGQSNVGNPDQKSKLVAGLFGILLGTFGVHNFYLGYKGKAIAQLLITLVSCGILAVVSAIWGLIEGIFILTGKIDTDANGVPLKD